MNDEKKTLVTVDPAKKEFHLPYSWLLPDKIECLTRLLKSISIWQEATDKEFVQYKIEAQNRKSKWEELDIDPIPDEAMMLMETERNLYACLGVSIAAIAENFTYMICKIEKIDCTDNSGKNNFGIACQKLENKIKDDEKKLKAEERKLNNKKITELSGYVCNQRARILGNCFKHNDGKTNEKCVQKKYSSNTDEVIEYENEDWESMIEGTNKFLEKLISLLEK